MENPEEPKKPKNPNDIKYISSVKQLKNLELNLNSPRMSEAIQNLGLSLSDCQKVYHFLYDNENI